MPADVCLTPEEMDALEHAQERVDQDGAHDLRGCPRFCRTMCSYGTTLRALTARGIEVPS